ncbi:hypothetical protein [Oceaniradius stylonematis]|uniref:hypothetical protein n=1 Tax=Oceaniradius stylonematis TaxID=2184161 RepID=UPI0011C4782E|nr:hypothetical protein [Oceaniradius stylonematis]
MSESEKFQRRESAGVRVNFNAAASRDQMAKAAPHGGLSTSIAPLALDVAGLLLKSTRLPPVNVEFVGRESRQPLKPLMQNNVLACPFCGLYAFWRHVVSVKRASPR